MFDFRESAIAHIMSLYDPEDRYRKLKRTVLEERIEKRRNDLLALDSEQLFLELIECVRADGYSDGVHSEYESSDDY